LRWEEEMSQRRGRGPGERNSQRRALCRKSERGWRASVTGK
jgi:hypothetical protein